MKTVFKTLRFKLFEPRRNKAESLDELFQEQVKTMNHYLNLAKELDITNKRELNDLTYLRDSIYSVRKTATLPSAYYQSIRDKAIQTHKSFKNKKGRKTFPSPGQIPLQLDKRTFRIIETNNWLKYFVSVTTNQGRKHIPIHAIRMNRYPAKYLKGIVSGKIQTVKAELLARGKDYWLYITIKQQLEIHANPNPQKLAIYSIDMGERNLVTCVSLRANSLITHSDIHFYKNPRGRLYKFQRIRTSLQKRNKISKVKSIGSKEKRFIRETNHKISRQVLEDVTALRKKGYQVVVVMGKLKGIRNHINRKVKKLNKYNNKIQNFSVLPKRLKKRLNNWSHYQLTSFLQYKLEWEGIETHLVPEQWTSKRCHRCGSLNTERPNQGLFRCLDCGYQCNSDFNGAVNIGCRRIGNRPGDIFPWLGAVSEPARTSKGSQALLEAPPFMAG